MTQRFEAIIATYGIPDGNGNVLTRSAAERIAEQAKNTKVVDVVYTPSTSHNLTVARYDARIAQWRDEDTIRASMHDHTLFRVVEARIEGDEQQGRVIVTCEQVR